MVEYYKPGRVSTNNYGQQKINLWPSMSSDPIFQIFYKKKSIIESTIRFHCKVFRKKKLNPSLYRVDIAKTLLNLLQCFASEMRISWWKPFSCSSLTAAIFSRKTLNENPKFWVWMTCWILMLYRSSKGRWSTFCSFQLYSI